MSALETGTAIHLDIQARLVALTAARVAVVNHVPAGEGLDHARTGHWLRKGADAAAAALAEAGIDPEGIPWPKAQARPAVVRVGNRFTVHVARLPWVDLDYATSRCLFSAGAVAYEAERYGKGRSYGRRLFGLRVRAVGAETWAERTNGAGLAPETFDVWGV